MFNHHAILDQLQLLPKWRLNDWEQAFVRSLAEKRNVAEAEDREPHLSPKQAAKLVDIGSRKLPQMEYERVFCDEGCR